MSKKNSPGWGRTLRQVQQIALMALGVILLLIVLSLVLRLFVYAVALVVVGILVGGVLYLYLLSRRRRR